MNLWNWTINELAGLGANVLRLSNKIFALGVVAGFLIATPTGLKVIALAGMSQWWIQMCSVFLVSAMCPLLIAIMWLGGFWLGSIAAYGSFMNLEWAGYIGYISMPQIIFFLCLGLAVKVLCGYKPNQFVWENKSDR